ncbi:MAG: hypothetical protein J6Y93_07055, partial [Treponema sp.]|nr:hypothetical protein [Treponema sp.]
YESKPYDFPNTTRMYLYATVDETVSGIKQIKYDTDYEAADIKAVYVKKSGWVSASYTVDAETKTITLAEPAITGTVGVLFGGCTSDNTHSASLIFIDAAENESESVLYTIE